jgi:hypothetical protein
LIPQNTKTFISVFLVSNKEASFLNAKSFCATMQGKLQVDERRIKNLKKNSELKKKIVSWVGRDVTSKDAETIFV